jgi:hypothetical protein
MMYELSLYKTTHQRTDLSNHIHDHCFSTIMGFIYLNYACQMEYVWSVYHMDSECIDFAGLKA